MNKIGNHLAMGKKSSDSETVFHKVFNLNRWYEHIQKNTTPLPGSVPYENHRQIRVLKRFDRMDTISFLTARFPHLDTAFWEKIIREGRLRIKDRPVSVNEGLRAGNILVNITPDFIEPEVSNRVSILYEDEAMLVVDKPAPLPVHPSGRYNKNTLISFLESACPSSNFGIVHRLDSDTTGVLLISKCRRVSKALRHQFDKNEVKKSYLVHVEGIPSSQSFHCSSPISRSPSIHGAREVHKNGRMARTDFYLQDKFSNGTSLIQAVPQTGRTNQIRLHISSLGFPIIGDPIYNPNIPKCLGETGRAKTMRLHASELGLRHPVSGNRIEFRALNPGWLTQILHE